MVCCRYDSLDRFLKSGEEEKIKGTLQGALVNKTLLRSYLAWKI